MSKWVCVRIVSHRSSALSNRQDHAQKSVEGVDGLINDDSSLDFTDFLDVSNSLLNGYVDIVNKGLPPPKIGLAMLGATVNLYQMFDMEGELVHLLRAVANGLDCKSDVH